MNFLGVPLVISLVLTSLVPASLAATQLSEQIIAPKAIQLASQPSAFNFNNFENMLPIFEEMNEMVCRKAPSGMGIPGFQPGIRKTDVFRMLGIPAVTASGYWPNTRAVSYELIPEEVSLGFLFDKHSERIRQTEAAFATKVDSQIVLLTLNGMLGCQLNEPIKQGLQKVQRRNTRRYFFTQNGLKGVIERDKRDRIYIGIWEADLHKY